MNATADTAPASATHPIQVAVVAALSATTMLFASLVSALLVRRSFPDWHATPAAWPFALLALGVFTSIAIEGTVRAGSQPRLARGVFVLSTLVYLASAAAAIFATSLNDGLAAPHGAFVALLLSLHVLHATLGSAFALWILSENSVHVSLGGRRSLARLVIHFLTALLAAIVTLLFVAS